MKQELIDELVKRTDDYTKDLWNRFYMDEPVDDTEKKIFGRLRSIAKQYDLDITNANDDVAAVLISTIEREGIFLPWTFFYPGTTSDIFIHLHQSVMNDHVVVNGFFEMIYVVKGSITDWVDGKEYDLSSGDFAIHNLNTRHRITRMNEQEDMIINIFMPPAMFQNALYFMLNESHELYNFFNCIISSTGTNVLIFRESRDYAEALVELLLREYLRGKEASNYVMESTLVVLFGELVRTYKIDSFSNDLMNYISENMQEVTAQSAADYFGFHRNYFPNIVRKHTGQSFNSLVTSARIQKSIGMLLFSDYTIEQISTELGYKSTASFYRHFKDYRGMLPNEYRKLYKK